MIWSLPPEITRIIYDFIHPIREYQKFQDLAKKRASLIIALNHSQELLSTWCINDRDPAITNDYFKDSHSRLDNMKTILRHIKTINQQIHKFYQKNPKLKRPIYDTYLTEHQHRLYQKDRISDLQIPRMDSNVSIRRGKLSRDDLILYDDLMSIMKDGTCTDLIYQCKINNIPLPIHLQSVPTDDVSKEKARVELIKIYTTF